MTQRIILPILLSVLTLAACSSQSQNAKGGAAGAGANGGSLGSGGSGSALGRGGNGGSGSTSGSIGRGGASGVNSSGSNGSNYLPGGSGGAGGGSNGGSGAGSGGNGNNADTNNAISLAGLKDPNNLLSQRIIYFDYDKASIRPEYMIVINTHAQLLAKFPNLKMRLEGHADERGSREYNVALSEARAQSVKSIMGLEGAKGPQIRTIGYGEEEPIVSGHNENSWQKNRRVEIKYDNY